MKSEKILTLVLGVTAVCALLTGICFVLASKTISIIGGIVIICLSLASGLILPNPISFFTLIAGICTLVFPPQIIGIVFAILGLAGMVTGGILWLKMNKSTLTNSKV